MSNTSVSPAILRYIKQQVGPVTADMQTLLAMREGFSAPGSGPPFVQVMGGINVSAFYHSYPTFADTNNLSAVYFVSYGPFKMLFPGDLERDGWREHLRNPLFVQHLRSTTILVASHHGRANGFSEEAFQYMKFQAVVISDKSIVYSTQETVPDYRLIVRDDGIRVTNEQGPRHVLTKRRDHDIVFRVEAAGNYSVTVRV
jgi:hypothetical protein